MRKRISVFLLLVLGGFCFAQTPKNIIIMIADGGGFNHYRAAELYRYSDSGHAVYRDFAVKMAMATYPAGESYDPNKAYDDSGYLNKGYTDSAAAATAMACGTKTKNGCIGLDENKEPLVNLMEQAEKNGKATGVVTSVPFSHATPAGFAAHFESRNDYKDIAGQMILKSRLDVIMGCGHPCYSKYGDKKWPLPDYKYIGKDCWEVLSAGAVAADADGDGIADPWTFIEERADFQKLTTGDAPKRVFGLAKIFETLQQQRDGSGNVGPYEVEFIETVPTLTEMTEGALNVLDADTDGFILMVEGGAVDWAAHANQEYRMIEELVEFENAIKAVIEWVAANGGWEETLVIVTADHETGYLELEQKGKSYKLDWHSKGHTNSLVPFFANGTGADNFLSCVHGMDKLRGAYIDNTDIAKVVLELLKMEQPVICGNSR
ncbi:MAG: alkaline phosphatase [Phycisphaerae bacterium]|nr:alkaline phosphatase [Phycisphaerae bacterium]